MCYNVNIKGGADMLSDEELGEYLKDIYDRTINENPFLALKNLV